MRLKIKVREMCIKNNSFSMSRLYLSFFRVAGKYKGSSDKDSELPLFSFSVISKATNNFSLNNKLGEGGFGSVYKVSVLTVF